MFNIYILFFGNGSQVHDLVPFCEVFKENTELTKLLFFQTDGMSQSGQSFCQKLFWFCHCK